MRRFFIVVLALVLMLCVSSIHVFADALSFPAVYIEADNGGSVDIQDYHTTVFNECYYPWCLEITDIEDVDGDFCVVTGKIYPVSSDSFSYRFMAYDWDWDIGDLAAVILSDNRTPEVYDDTVLSAKYIGYVADTTWLGGSGSLIMGM